MTASRTPSEIWSAILSGWPSVTDSEVNRYSFSERFALMCSGVTAPRSGATVREDPGEMGQIGSEKGSEPLPRGAGPAAPAVVDHERHALEPVARAQPVLDEEAVVARQRPALVDLDGEARRARLVLRHVEHLQPLAADVRRRARGGD